MERDLFIDPTYWQGGPSYELIIEFWPRGAGQWQPEALAALWRSPLLEGPWREPAHFVGATELPTDLNNAIGTKLYGVLSLADGAQLGCCSTTLRVTDDAVGSEWLSLFIYYQSLTRTFGPEFEASSHWIEHLRAIDQQFLALAEAVYLAARFSFASIGFEGRLTTGQRGLSLTQISRGGLILPPAYITAHRLGAQISSVILPSGLHWLPPK